MCNYLIQLVLPVFLPGFGIKVNQQFIQLLCIQLSKLVNFSLYSSFKKKKAPEPTFFVVFEC